MAFVTPKTDWAAGDTPLHTDFNRAEGNTAVLGNLRTYPTATGTGTAIVVATGYFELTAGRACSFIAAADNLGAATTINVDATGVKNLYKEGGTDAPILITGKAYTVWYNGTSFFVKANASGNALVSDVLATKTFSNDSGTDLTGTMPNNAGDVNAVSSHSGGGGTIHIVPATGYTDGSDDASVITDAEFLAANIKHNVEIFGLTGTYDTEAVNPIAAATVQKDKIGFVNGTKITGSLQPAATDIKTGATIAGVTGTYDTEASVPIAAGTVLSGKKGWVNGSQIVGTMPIKDNPTTDNVTVSLTNNEVIIPEGYYDGTDVKAVLSLVTSGVNQVYTVNDSVSDPDTSGVYYQISSATVNYPGTYKITLTSTPSGFVNSFSVKVNGVVKATSSGTITFDLALAKSDTLLVEAKIDYVSTPASLDVTIVASIAEPITFIV